MFPTLGLSKPSHLLIGLLDFWRFWSCLSSALDSELSWSPSCHPKMDQKRGKVSQMQSRKSLWHVHFRPFFCLHFELGLLHAQELHLFRKKNHIVLLVTLTPIKMLGTLNPCLHTSWHTGLRPLVSCTDLETAIWRHPAERLQGGDRSLCSYQQKHTPKEKLISLEYTPDSKTPLENDGVSRNECHTAKTEWQMMRKWHPKPSKTSQSSFGQTPTQRRIALLTGFKARLVFRVAFLYNLSLHKDRPWNKLGLFHHLCFVCELNQYSPQVHFAFFALLYWEKTKRILISIVAKVCGDEPVEKARTKTLKKKKTSVKIYSLVVEPTHPKKCSSNWIIFPGRVRKWKNMRVATTGPFIKQPRDGDLAHRSLPYLLAPPAFERSKVGLDGLGDWKSAETEGTVVLLMEEILQQLICKRSPYCRVSYISDGAGFQPSTAWKMEEKTVHPISGENMMWKYSKDSIDFHFKEIMKRVRQFFVGDNGEIFIFSEFGRHLCHLHPSILIHCLRFHSFGWFCFPHLKITFSLFILTLVLG